MKYLYGLMLAFLAAAPVAAQDTPLSQILIDGEGWKKVDHRFRVPLGFTGLATDRAGNVYVPDREDMQIYRIDKDGKVTPFLKEKAVYVALAFGPDGKLYASQNGKERLVTLDADGKATVLAEKIDVDGLAVTNAGDCYVTSSDVERGAILLIRADGKRQTVATGLGVMQGVVLWPDQGTLVIAKSDGLYTFRVEKDGTLTGRERYYSVHALTTDLPFFWGLTIDRQSRVYAISQGGVQFFDGTGRFSGLLSPPRGLRCIGLTFGGPDLDRLYTVCGGQVYYRKLKAQGVPWPEKKSPSKDK